MPAAPPFPFPEHVGWLRITCMPAAPPFPFPVHVGPEDHVHAITWVHAAPPVPFPVHSGYQLGHWWNSFLVSAKPRVAPTVACNTWAA